MQILLMSFADKEKESQPPLLLLPPPKYKGDERNFTLISISSAFINNNNYNKLTLKVNYTVFSNFYQ